MTEDRLIELIEAWGADPSGFPQADRTAAKALLAARPERFAAALSGAQALDAALARMPEVLPSAMLAEALIASAPQARPARGGFSLPKVAPWAPASGFAALAAGLFMGVLAAPAASASGDAEDIEAVIAHALGYDPAAFTGELGE